MRNMSPIDRFRTANGRYSRSASKPTSSRSADALNGRLFEARFQDTGPHDFHLIPGFGTAVYLDPAVNLNGVVRLE